MKKKLTTLWGKDGTRSVLASLLSSFFMSLLIRPVFLEGQIISYWVGNWAPRAGYAIGIGFEVDGLSLFFALLVSLTVLLSNIYSLRYIDRDDCGDYYCTLALMLGGGLLATFAALILETVGENILGVFFRYPTRLYYIILAFVVVACM